VTRTRAEERAAGAVLRPGFYERPADVVAKELLGKLLLVRDEAAGGFRAGRIVETEAYLGEADLACHASKGLTRRTATLFGPAGHAYVYLIYGMYDLFNVVCQPEGVPHAVLVRAVEPLPPTDASPAPAGLPLVEAPAGARGDGPGRLTRALGITRAHDAAPLHGPVLYVLDGPAPADVRVTARVGVAYSGPWADAPLRYLDPASRHVSRPSPAQLGSGRRGR